MSVDITVPLIEQVRDTAPAVLVEDLQAPSKELVQDVAPAVVTEDLGVS